MAKTPNSGASMCIEVKVLPWFLKFRQRRMAAFAQMFSILCCMLVFGLVPLRSVNWPSHRGCRNTQVWQIISQLVIRAAAARRRTTLCLFRQRRRRWQKWKGRTVTAATHRTAQLTDKELLPKGKGAAAAAVGSPFAQLYLIRAGVEVTVPENCQVSQSSYTQYIL